MKILLSFIAVFLPSLPACKNPAPAVSTQVEKDEVGSSYRLEAGPFEVASIEELVLRDEARGKDLPLTIRYPQGEGPFPLIVFSHGLGGAGKHYFPLTQHWATHGFVVLQPTHADSLSLQGGLDEDEERRPRERIFAALKKPGAAQQRAKDISFLIDSIGKIQEKVPQLAGKIDTKRIGVGGHSFGAHTTQLLAGALHLGENHADDRVQAFLLLSGQGPGRAGLSENSWEKISSPMMVLSGSLDFTGARAEGPQWRMEPYRRAPAGDKYSIFIEGATHASFSGRPASKGMEDKKVFEAVKISTLAFWDAYLKKSKLAKDYLSSRSLVEWGKPIVSYERK